MNKTNPEVDAFLRSAKKWQEELAALRKIILGCDLIEVVKWQIPVYTIQNSNVVSIAELKACCVLSFFKGALLKDSHGILTKPGENTRAARVIRFTDVQKIVEMELILKAYIGEAVEVEKAGLKVDFKEDSKPELPAEVHSKFDELPALKNAFDALTPGRHRAYALFFAAPKQSKTRVSRVEKYTQQILDGKGLHDCTCGLSQKLPSCDGSHKQIR